MKKIPLEAYVLRIHVYTRIRRRRKVRSKQKNLKFEKLTKKNYGVTTPYQYQLLDIFFLYLPIKFFIVLSILPIFLIFRLESTIIQHLPKLQRNKIRYQSPPYIRHLNFLSYLFINFAIFFSPFLPHQQIYPQSFNALYTPKNLTYPNLTQSEEKQTRQSRTWPEHAGA